MIRSRYLSTLAIAGALATVPAFANDTTSATTSGSTVKSAESTRAASSTGSLSTGRSAADQSAQATRETLSSTTDKPLCSSLDHPNAGKLADKDTGQAKEHSASPVHMDCIPDAQASSSTTGWIRSPLRCPMPAWKATRERSCRPTPSCWQSIH